jgi:uncharacterized membrane protein YsdA (DUF1294 family)
MKLIIPAILIGWNLFVLSVFAADKAKSKKKAYRTPESILLLLSFLMGSTGALLGMHLLRHKTKHLKFQVLVPLSFLFNAFVLFLLITWHVF